MLLVYGGMSVGEDPGPGTQNGVWGSCEILNRIFVCEFVDFFSFFSGFHNLTDYVIFVQLFHCC